MALENFIGWLLGPPVLEKTLYTLLFSRTCLLNPTKGGRRI